MSSDDLYDLAEDTQSEPRLQAPATAPFKGGAGAVAPVGQPQRVQTVAYRSSGAIATSGVGKYFPDPVMDLYLPLVLIGGGAIVQIGYAFLFSPFPLRLAMKQLVMDMFISTAFMLVVMLIVAKARNINLGPLPVAVMKLCALSLGPQAIVILIAPLIFFIPLGAAIVQFAMWFALLGTMFDLDQNDTWFCVCVLIILAIGVILGARWLF